MRILLSGLIVFSLAIPLSAQRLVAIATNWSDDLSEWTLYTDIEDLTGELALRNPFQDEPTAWRYTLGDYHGTIKLLSRGPAPEWELRGNGHIVVARPIFGNDIRQWRIHGPGGKVLSWKSRFGNTLADWEVRDEQRGYFATYMAYANDPREWDAVDETDETVTFEERLLMLFIATFYGSRF